MSNPANTYDVMLNVTHAHVDVDPIALREAVLRRIQSSGTCGGHYFHVNGKDVRVVISLIGVVP